MDPLEARDLLTGPLLALEGVSGIGVVGDKLAVYLERDDDSLRSRVQALANAKAPGTAIQFFVAGEFRAY